MIQTAELVQHPYICITDSGHATMSTFSIVPRVGAPESEPSESAPWTVSIRIQYTGSHDTRLQPSQRDTCAHVWDDTVRMPQLGDAPAPEGVDMWRVVQMTEQGGCQVCELSMEVPAAARHVYVAVFENRGADDDGSAHVVVVRGERRAQAMLALEPIRDGTRVETALELPEAGRELGLVLCYRGDRGARVGTVSRVGIDGHASAAAASAAMEQARALGTSMAEKNTALPGVPGLTIGMLNLDTRYQDAERTGMPGWFWMLNMPRTPESPQFVEGIVCAAAELRGIPDAEVAMLAAAALRDATHGERERRAQPSADTVKFAMLVAEAAYVAVTRAHYLTDAFDANKPGRAWRDALMEPVERMSANMREDGADDCEGYAAGAASIMYGIARGAEDDRRWPVHAAARAICRCYLPLVTLGQAVRTGGDGPQYNLGDDTNAHAWLMLVSTSGMRTSASQQPRCAQSVALDLDLMADPWEVGLPTLLLDGTSHTELYPRQWGESHHRTRSETARTIQGAHGFVTVMRPMNAGFHRVCRNGYTPYGLRDSKHRDRRVFEVYWYSTVDAAEVVRHFKDSVVPYLLKQDEDRQQAELQKVADYLVQAADAHVHCGLAPTHAAAAAAVSAALAFLKIDAKEILSLIGPAGDPTGGEYLRYGAPTVDIFRLSPVAPPGFCQDPPPASAYPTISPTPWMAATMSVSRRSLATLRPAAAMMHPVRPAPPARDRGGSALAAAVRPLLAFAASEPLQPAAEPWGAPPRTMTVKYADAADGANITALAQTLSELKNAKLHMYTREFWGGEPQLWIVEA